MAPNPSDSTGMQFFKKSAGGFLGTEFRSKAGLPVINIPGCPAHPDWITQIIVALATGRGGDLALDEYQRPTTFFTSFTQTGCTRDMMFAYKVSTTEFGQRKGCLFMISAAAARSPDRRATGSCGTDSHRRRGPVCRASDVLNQSFPTSTWRRVRSFRPRRRSACRTRFR